MYLLIILIIGRSKIILNTNSAVIFVIVGAVIGVIIFDNQYQ